MSLYKLVCLSITNLVNPLRMNTINKVLILILVIQFSNSAMYGQNNLPVDLNKVKYTTGSVNHDTASIFLGKHQYKNDLGQYVFGPLIQLSDIPALLEYEGKKLNVIEYINKGSFGTVIRYSERTPLPDE